MILLSQHIFLFDFNILAYGPLSRRNLITKMSFNNNINLFCNGIEALKDLDILADNNFLVIIMVLVDNDHYAEMLELKEIHVFKIGLTWS